MNFGISFLLIYTYLVNFARTIPLLHIFCSTCKFCYKIAKASFFLHFYNRAINPSSQIISLGLGSNPFQIFFHTLQISTLLSFSVTLGRYIKHKSHRIPHFEKILLLLTIILLLVLSAYA